MEEKKKKTLSKKKAAEKSKKVAEEKNLTRAEKPGNIKGSIVPKKFSKALAHFEALGGGKFEHKVSISVLKVNKIVVLSVMRIKGGGLCMLANRCSPDAFPVIKEKKTLGDFRKDRVNGHFMAFALTEEPTRGQERLVKIAYKMAMQTKKDKKTTMDAVRAIKDKKTKVVKEAKKSEAEAASLNGNGAVEKKKKKKKKKKLAEAKGGEFLN